MTSPPTTTTTTTHRRYPNRCLSPSITHSRDTTPPTHHTSFSLHYTQLSSTTHHLTFSFDISTAPASTHVQQNTLPLLVRYTESSPQLRSLQFRFHSVPAWRSDVEASLGCVMGYVGDTNVREDSEFTTERVCWTL